MMYLHLFHGRKDFQETMEDWGFDGPTFGPFTTVHATYAETLRCIPPAGPECWFSLRDGLVFYDGSWFGDFAVLVEPVPQKVELFDEEKTRVPPESA
jgi:hypothetical protein